MKTSNLDTKHYYREIMKSFGDYCKRNNIYENKDNFYDFYEGRGIDWAILDRAWDYWYYGG